MLTFYWILVLLHAECFLGLVLDTVLYLCTTKEGVQAFRTDSPRLPYLVNLGATISDFGLFSYNYLVGEMVARWLTWPVIHVKDPRMNMLLKGLVLLKRFHEYLRQFLWLVFMDLAACFRQIWQRNIAQRRHFCRLFIHVIMLYNVHTI